MHSTAAWLEWMHRLDGLPREPRLAAILAAGFPSWTGPDGWTQFALWDGRVHMVRPDVLAALEDGVFRPPSPGDGPPWKSADLACADMPPPPPLPPRRDTSPVPMQHGQPSPWHLFGPGSGAPEVPVGPQAAAWPEPPAVREPPPPLPPRPSRPPLRNAPPRAPGPAPSRRTAQAAAQRDLSDLGL